MRLHTRLFVVLAVFGVALFVVGTGAFTTVSAERTVSVNVAGDSSALLGLEPHKGPNGNGDTYAEESDGELRITISTDTADGVNQNAATSINRVFNITNQGTQDVDVYIDKSGENHELVEFQNDSNAVVNGSSNAVNVPVGGTVQVSIEIDTRGETLGDGDEILNAITVHADA